MSKFSQVIAARYDELWIPPEERNADLAEEMETAALGISRQLAGPDQPGEDYRAKVGRLTRARTQADEIVSTDMLPQPPEDWKDPDDAMAEPPSWPADPDHPLNDDDYVKTLSDDQIDRLVQAYYQSPNYRTAMASFQAWEDRMHRR